MKKGLFEILHEMNQNDIENKTSSVSIGNTLISSKYSDKMKGTILEIGIGGNHLADIIVNKKIAIVVLVDYQEYQKLTQ